MPTSPLLSFGWNRQQTTTLLHYMNAPFFHPELLHCPYQQPSHVHSLWNPVPDFSFPQKSASLLLTGDSMLHCMPCPLGCPATHTDAFFTLPGLWHRKPGCQQQESTPCTGWTMVPWAMWMSSSACLLRPNPSHAATVVKHSQGWALTCTTWHTGSQSKLIRKAKLQKVKRQNSFRQYAVYPKAAHV